MDPGCWDHRGLIAGDSWPLMRLAATACYRSEQSGPVPLPLPSAADMCCLPLLKTRPFVARRDSEWEQQRSKLCVFRWDKRPFLTQRDTVTFTIICRLALETWSTMYIFDQSTTKTSESRSVNFRAYSNAPWPCLWSVSGPAKLPHQSWLQRRTHFITVAGSSMERGQGEIEPNARVMAEWFLQHNGTSFLWVYQVVFSSGQAMTCWGV